jgi:hypothetical protein
MADVMSERVRSIQRCVGVCFITAALLLTFSIVAQPTFGDVNRVDRILDALSKQGWGAWMQLHAVMILGFALATAGFAALAFLFHLRGSSGAASIIGASALLGGTLWVLFFSAELYGYKYLLNLYSIDPGGATALFSSIWFWKMGGIAVAAGLTFVAVIGSGVTGTSRGFFPVWLGWGGAFFAIAGLAIYFFDYLGSTATGAAINPMQSPGVRYFVGLPLQLWLLGVGIHMMRAYLTGQVMIPAAAPAAPKPASSSAPKPSTAGSPETIPPG